MSGRNSVAKRPRNRVRLKKERARREREGDLIRMDLLVKVRADLTRDDGPGLLRDILEFDKVNRAAVERG